MLVNNAGILRFALIESQPLDEYRAVVDVNQVGCFLGMQAAIPADEGQRRRVDRQHSSTTGFIGVAGLVGLHRDASSRCAA